MFWAQLPAGWQRKFIRSVHQALLETTEDLDEELFARLAGSSISLHDVDDNAPSPPPCPDDLDDPSPPDIDDSASHALEAIGLNQLLHW